MTQSKTDPRIVRTRKLIMDSFIELSGKKEFKDITVKDITTEAMINRATFYYHFEDIYDLLEKVLSEVLLINLDYEVFEKNELNEESIVSMFIAITNFQTSLSNRCHRGYEDTIARIIREQLEITLYKMLVKQHTTEKDEALKTATVMLSWGIYGASTEWRRNSEKVQPPEDFIKSVVPYILHGIGFGSRD
ncbi:TetR/AcrR family transcriptional regulator [Neobacillus kokaensis]|uniref:TetR/AcrR family transcriptional regulator n=1 Tax=Neobacillus kokaensis TaxID=2759023 RepID=A0ABQ3N820_9BACI|nr:TetR/AcrR family transcriptional regulator [Neobacillus kokaensis]GHH99663.1 TetR/AcrR family transcriptional regulator [Neobacillus kokaensis]